MAVVVDDTRPRRETIEDAFEKRGFHVGGWDGVMFNVFSSKHFLTARKIAVFFPGHHLHLIVRDRRYVDRLKDICDEISKRVQEDVSITIQ
jgi:hypothetical protein